MLFLPGGLLLAGTAIIGYMVVKGPVLPLSDAYALDVSKNTGADYARMRLWGSVGFIVANMAGGALATATSSWLVLALTALSSIVTGAVVMSLPRQHRDQADESGNETGQVAPFREIWFWPVLVVLGLFQASHAAFYGFGTIYLQANHVPDFAIGALWAIGVVAEVALFTVAGKLSLRFDPPTFLIVAGIASVIRWVLFPFADTLAFLVALQLLHGLTFGAAHLGAVAILSKVVPSRWAGTGQGLFMMSIGVQMSAGLAVSGAIYETDPHAPFYLMAAVAAVGTVALIVLTPMIRRQIRMRVVQGIESSG